MHTQNVYIRAHIICFTAIYLPLIVSLVLDSCLMKVGRIKGFYLINSTVSRSNVCKNGTRH